MGNENPQLFGRRATLELLSPTSICYDLLNHFFTSDPCDTPITKAQSGYKSYFYNIRSLKFEKKVKNITLRPNIK